MRRRTEKAEIRCGEFLRHANFCDALAVDVTETVDQAALSEMAARWRELAGEARPKTEAVPVGSIGMKLSHDAHIPTEAHVALGLV